MVISGKTFWQKCVSVIRTVVPFAMFIIGLGGVPDDLVTWTRWIDFVTREETIQRLAEYMVGLADFVNQWPVRATLVIVSLLLLIWPWRRFWRVRHKVLYRVKLALGQMVWIGTEDAIDVIKNSRWGEARAPRTNMFGPIGVLSSLSPDYAAQRQKFDDFCEMVLGRFARNNPDSVKESGDDKQYNEENLRAYLTKIYERELEEEFGKIPDASV